MYKRDFLKILFGKNEIRYYICSPFIKGALAQLVEQRTENPCVPGSIPGGTTLEGFFRVWESSFFILNS